MIEAAAMPETLFTVWPEVERGRLKPVIDTIFPLVQAAEAHRRMESGEHVGKIVLQV
jgi:NADPH:quinone reductase-like Zn-dependent oxidoreductase